MNFEALENFCNSKKIKYKMNEPMALHTSFKIGGPAEFFVLPESLQQLSELINALATIKIPYFILGKGSNLLVSDKGIVGVVISLCEIKNISVSGNKIVAEAGASLAAVCVAAQQNGLSGLEFAYGIPGCVGGALYMNAGAYGGEMSQVVCSAECMDSTGNTETVLAEDMKLGYRTSIFKENEKIITSVAFELKSGNCDEIQAQMDDFMQRRKSKQPLECPSAGSTFKRPAGYFAGALIEKNNLKGTRVGGAMVSEKHAGFVINYDNATCEDVKNLMGLVQNKVREADGVTLEPEVIFVGKK